MVVLLHSPNAFTTTDHTEVTQDGACTILLYHFAIRSMELSSLMRPLDKTNQWLTDIGAGQRLQSWAVCCWMTLVTAPLWG